MPQHLRLVEVDRVASAWLPDFLYEMIGDMSATSRQRIAAQFPGVLSRYDTLAKTRETVNGHCRAMYDSRRRFWPFAIFYGTHPIGLATASQRCLKRRVGFLRSETIVDGPMLAAWLVNFPRPSLLPDLLALAQNKLVCNGRMYGRPWTVVDVDHKYVRDVLEETTAFGGFSAGLPGDWSLVGDGVSAPRVLYIAKSTLGYLRA